MLIYRVLLAAFLSFACAAASAADGFDPQQLFLGAGISRNELPNTDEGTGFQLFAGYRFGEVSRNVEVDAEVGYMDTGDMDRRGPGGGSAEAEGLWATAVLRLILGPQLELLGRAGADFGDDDGLMVGAGAGFNLGPQLQMRLEYVQRDNVDSLQLNFVFWP